jgi:hypothetical protein
VRAVVAGRYAIPPAHPVVVGENVPVGKHSGERTETPALPRGRLLALALGITATLVAWGFLVWEAVNFGSQGRDGEALAWVFLALATFGATACLFLTLILGTKVLATLRARPPVPEPMPGGRRAAR